LKRILRLPVMMLVIIVVGILVLAGLGMIRLPAFLNQGEIPITEIPKDVPIVNGKIVSVAASRSDDLIREVTIVVETNLTLGEVVKYYNGEFTKRGFTVRNIPAFQGNAREVENWSEAQAGAENKSRQEISVFIKSEPQFTQVTIQVRGNSILFLPE